MDSFVETRMHIALVRTLRSRAMSDANLARLVHRIRAEGRALMGSVELRVLAHWVRATANLGGDALEVGVYKGGSAKLILEEEHARTVHLFDTFEGLAGADGRDLLRDGFLRDTSAEAVRSYLAGYPNARIHIGRFPETAGRVEGPLSFVHLDVDLYRSTLDSLAYVYPRMLPGAALVSHDYDSAECPGVREAIDEFFADKPETPVPITGTCQCVIVRCKSTPAVGTR